MAEEIPAGSFATGRDSAALQLKMSSSKWYRLIKKLELLDLISVKSNNRFSVITVKNWGVYQEQVKAVNNQRTTDEQRMNNQRTTDEQPANTIEERKEREEGKEGKNKVVSVDGYSEEFETFWKAFPPKRRTKKAAAFTAFQKAIKKGVSVEKITEAAREYANSDEAHGQYVQGPAPWLNEGRWDDEREAWKSKSAPVPKSKSQTLIENINNNMDAFING